MVRSPFEHSISFSISRFGLFAQLYAQNVQHHQLQHNGNAQQDQRGPQAGAAAQEHLGQAGDHIARGGTGCGGNGVGQLGGNMVHMAAMRTGRGHDGGVGNGRAVVAAHSAGQAGRNGDHQHLALRESVADNGDQDGEGAPGGAGGKGQEHRHQEDDDRQQVLQGGSGAAQQVGNVIFCTQQVGHAGKRPGQGQDQHGADHGLEALGDAGGKILERHHAADTVEHKGEHQGNAAAQHQTGGGIAVGEGGDEVHALKEAAGVDQAKDAGRDQHQHRGHQINDMAVGIVPGIHIVAVGAVSRGEKVAGPGIVLVLLHGAVVRAREDEEQAHHNGQQGVIVVGNGVQEHGKAVDAGAFGHAGGNGGGPAGHRRNDAHRGGGGINEVSQLCAGDLLPVGHGAHHRAHGQAVEVVVHKNEHAQNKGGKLRPGPGVDVGGGPAAKGGGAAGLVHQGHQNAQHHQKDQNAHVAAVRELGDHAAVLVEEQGGDRQLQVAVGKEQRAGGNAHQQGGVDLLGVQGQHNGHHRRQQGKHGAVHRRGVAGRVGNGAGGGCGAPQQQGKHQQCPHPGEICLFHK